MKTWAADVAHITTEMHAGFWWGNSKALFSSPRFIMRVIIFIHYLRDYVTSQDSTLYV
jgi:hypothetical protein